MLWKKICFNFAVLVTFFYFFIPSNVRLFLVQENQIMHSCNLVMLCKFSWVQRLPKFKFGLASMLLNHKVTIFSLLIFFFKQDHFAGYAAKEGTLRWYALSNCSKKKGPYHRSLTLHNAHLKSLTFKLFKCTLEVMFTQRHTLLFSPSAAKRHMRKNFLKVYRVHLLSLLT